MSMVLFLLLWLVSPFLELVIIIVLWKDNQRYKDKVRDLESRLYGRQRPPFPQGQPVNRPLSPTGYPGAQAVPPGAPMRQPGFPAGQPMPQPAPTADQMPMPQPASTAGQVPVPQPAPTADQRPMPQPVPPAGQRLMPGPAAARPSGSRVNVMGTAALIVGIIFVVLAGLIFSTTTWKVLPDIGKVLLVAFFACIFFGSSFIAEKKLHIHKTGNGLYLLGSIFLSLSVLAACYFRFLGSAFVLEGANRYRVLWVGSLVTVAVWFAGMRRFYDRLFTHVCLWGLTVSMIFLELSFALPGEYFAQLMLVYAFCLLLLEWGIEWREGRQAGRNVTGERESRETETAENRIIEGKQSEEGGTGHGVTWAQAFHMLLEEMTLFVPVHFGLFAVICVYHSVWEILFRSQRRILTLFVLALTAVGTALLCTRRRKIPCQWLFIVSLLYFTHYVFGAWIFPEQVIYALLASQGAAVLCFAAGRRRKGSLLSGSSLEGAVCTAAACMDALGITGLSWMGDITVGEQLAVSAAVVLVAVMVYLWGSKEQWVTDVIILLCLYLTVTAWNIGRVSVSGCPDYEVFAVIYLCLVILWGFWKKKDCWISIVIIDVITMISFPLSVVPILILAVTMAAGRKTGREFPGRDRLLCLLYAASVLGFYRKPSPELWHLGLFLLISWMLYLLFYRRKCLWQACLSAVSMLFVPLELWGRYHITGDKLYMAVAAALLLSGVIFRLRAPIIKKEEEEPGRWQLDLYHMLSAAPLLIMSLMADAYWRFGYLLLLSLYCLQYVPVKGFEGWEKVRRFALTAAAAFLLPAFWLQPYVVLPEIYALEICMLPAAAFLWLLTFIWGSSRELRDVQTVGYVFCLAVLAMDAVLTGQVEDGLLLEGICLLLFVWAKIRSYMVWEAISVIFLFGFSAVVFYEGMYGAALSIGLFLVTFWLSYFVFYQRKYARLYGHMIGSFVMLPAPFILHSRYEITGDLLYMTVAMALLISGIGFRLAMPVIRKEEGETGIWRIDFYHILCAAPLLFMIVLADAYWRFGYLLLLGLYCLQYVPVKGFEGWEKVRRCALTGLGGCLLLAIWFQPYVALPEVLSLELWLLPAALFLLSLSYIWGKSKTLWNVQTAAYVCMLLLLAFDGVRTGRVEDALMLGGVCLLVFVWSLVKSCRRWMRISGILIVAEALYMTKDFWFSLSWWVYLLAAGIGLLLFAAISEKRKK